MLDISATVSTTACSKQAHTVSTVQILIPECSSYHCSSSEGNNTPDRSADSTSERNTTLEKVGELPSVT